MSRVFKVLRSPRDWEPTSLRHSAAVAGRHFATRYLKDDARRVRGLSRRPPPGRRRAVSRGPRAARRRGVSRITLLGDIFHFFIAHPKFETPAIARFLETVRRLAAGGVPVTYVEGNRDFFLRGQLRREGLRPGLRRGGFRGRRRPLSRDARRPPEREGHPVPLLALPLEEPALARRDRRRPERRGQPSGLEGGGAPVSLQLQAQVAASGGDDSRLRGAPVPLGDRRPASRALPQVLERARRRRVASRSFRPSSKSGAGWRSRTTDPRRSSLSSSGIRRGMTDYLAIPPAREMAGELRVPASKSATNRALLAGALSSEALEIVGTSRQRRHGRAAALPRGDGRRGSRRSAEAWRSAARFRGPAGAPAALDAGDSGTAARFLAAAAAAVPGRFALTGSARLRERPIGELVDALRSAGARIEYAGQRRMPPALDRRRIARLRNDHRRRLTLEPVLLGAPPRGRSRSTAASPCGPPAQWLRRRTWA